MAEFQHIPTPANEQEEWRPVVGWEGWYEVSDLGRVRRVKNTSGARFGRLLIGKLDRYGYRVVTLSSPQRQVSVTVHTVVASAFLGIRPEGYEVHHKDGNRQNPCLTNLEYVTQKRNVQIAWEMGRRPSHGEANAAAKLTESDVAAIRGSDASNDELAARFGVDRRTIWKVRTGRSWRRNSEVRP